MRFSHPIHRGEAVPEVNLVLMLHSKLSDHLRFHIAWRDGIHPDIVFGPLEGETLSQHDNTGLGDIIGGLGLRGINNDAGHRRRVDD